MKTLTEMLTEREAIAQLTETILDEGTEHWGVKASDLCAADATRSFDLLHDRWSAWR